MLRFLRLTVAMATVLVGLLLVALLPSPGFCGFLSMEEGARATGMGGAFLAVADDASCVFWNPAGLGFTSGLKLTGMRTRLYSISDLSEDCVSVTYSGWHRAGFGLGWARTGLEDIYNENTYVFGAGTRFLSDGLSVGGALRIYHLAAPGYDYYNDPNFTDGDTGYAADAGLLYRGSNWSVAAAVRNLGEPELSLISTTEASDPIYTEYRIGGTYTFREVMLLAGEVRRSADVPGYYEGKTSYYLGTEVWFYDVFALRSGLHGDKATAGLGLKIDNLSIDGALISEGRPGTKYRLSVSLDF